MSLSSLFDQLKADAVGIEWPQVLTGETASVFSALYDLSRTERLPPDELGRLQNAQLDRLLRHAAAQVPFYTERLRSAGYRAGKTTAADIWNAIPVLTRSDIQEAGDRLRAKSYPQSHGALREWTTSGSTNRPVRIATTELTAFQWTCLNMRDRLWHDIDLGGTLVLLTDGARKMAGRPFVEQGSWSLDASSLRKPGKHFKVNPSLKPADLVRTIRKIDPTYIQTRPSQLNLLAKECETSGERFGRLRAVFCVSELVTDTLRQACTDLFGVPIIECYSCAEAGYLALQCPEAGRLHVQSEMVRVEVLGAGNAPCAPGETGRVVVTSLHNYAMPLIRYEIGDDAEAGRALRMRPRPAGAREAPGPHAGLSQAAIGPARPGEHPSHRDREYSGGRRVSAHSARARAPRDPARRAPTARRGGTGSPDGGSRAAGRRDLRGRGHLLPGHRTTGVGQVPVLQMRGRMIPHQIAAAPSTIVLCCMNASHAPKMAAPSGVKCACSRRVSMALS